MLKGLHEVPVIKLNESLRRSGLNVTRLDRELGPNQALFRKGGQKSGGRFSLNNQGVQQAEKWIAEWA
jgi:general stress protein YciG